MAAYRGYLRALVDRKHAERGDDLASDLLAIHDEDAEQLTRAEIASILFSLSFAGHETTTGLIGNAVRRLLEEPERWDAIAAEPRLIPGAVDETLRFDPSVPVWRRITTRPVELGGVVLPQGAKLFLWLAAAGRDAAVFADPDRFDPRRRNADQHLAFGRGLHYCLGAHLGKVETRIALERLVERFPRLRLVPGQSLTFHPTSRSAGRSSSGSAPAEPAAASRQAIGKGSNISAGATCRSTARCSGSVSSACCARMPLRREGLSEAGGVIVIVQLDNTPSGDGQPACPAR